MIYVIRQTEKTRSAMIKYLSCIEKHDLVSATSFTIAFSLIEAVFIGLTIIIICLI